MTVHPQNYTRRPFTVEAVKVFEKNLEDVAAWCGGTVVRDQGRKPYVSVPVRKADKIQQTQAFVNCYVVKAPRQGFRVYTNKTFFDNFYKTGAELLQGLVQEDDNYGAHLEEGV